MLEIVYISMHIARIVELAYANTFSSWTVVPPFMKNAVFEDTNYSELSIEKL